MTGIAGPMASEGDDDRPGGSMAVMEAALVRVLAGAVTMTSDKFVLDAHTSERPEGVYVQGLVEEDGALFLEVPSNAFLESPLGPSATDRLLALGWQPPEEELPNYWRLVPAAEIVPGPLAAHLVRTLVDVYGVRWSDEFTIFPADLAEDALLDAGVQRIGQGGGAPEAELVGVLLRLLGAQEFGTHPWGHLYRLPETGEAVVLTRQAARPELRVEVPDVDPAGLNDTWRLRPLPFEVEAGPAASGVEQSLWVVHAVDPAAISLNLLRDQLETMRAMARQLSSHAERISEAEQEQATLWAELEAIDPDAARLVRLLGDGDEPTGGAPNAGLLARWMGRDYVVGGYWHIPEPLLTPALASRWLMARYAPDCGHLHVGEDSLVVAGAIGWVALAVEVARQPKPEHKSLQGLLADELIVARKAATLVRPLMPAGEFGWLRPLLLEGSAGSGAGRVLRYDPDLEEMADDGQLTTSWRAILASPEDQEALNELKSGIARAVDGFLSAADRADSPGSFGVSPNTSGSEGASDPEMVRRPTPADCHVVPGSTPVVAFGDPSVAAVATLGINPSRAEFLDDMGALLRGARRRLATLDSLGARSTEDLSDEQVRRVYQECADYFHRNPYRTWFDRLDGLLQRALNVSYYADTACHLDIVQWATDPIWRRIPDRAARQLLLDEGAPHLRRQLETENVRLVVVNGDQAWRQLGATGLAEYEDVGSLPYGNGSMTTALRRGRGCGVTFLGWSLNIQSSFGVRVEDRHALSDWLGQAAVEG